MAEFTPIFLLKVFSPFAEFVKSMRISGNLLLLAAAIAIILANSSISQEFVSLWQIPVTIGIASLSIKFTLAQFINDGLMTFFFAVVGLEIKRELSDGELSSRAKALMPIVGALGGMLVPAIIYFLFNYGTENIHGWGIPTATDIAFTLTVISLLGNRIPLWLKVFLTALAVVDDLGAIVLIALFYSGTVEWMSLMYALFVLGVLILMNRFDVRNIWLYLLVGVFLWINLHHAGIHATISGVLLAMTVPYRYRNYDTVFNKHLKEVLEFSQMLESTPESKRDKQKRDRIIEEMQRTSTYMEAPLNNMLYLLSGFSGFIIMPLFALANAGIIVDWSALSSVYSSVGFGIILGLMLGKPIGITALTWITCKLKITVVPKGTNWAQVFCVNILAGIGFTMSIFVTNLAFVSKSSIETAKLSVIIASLLSGVLGFVLLKLIPFRFIEDRTIG